MQHIISQKESDFWDEMEYRGIKDVVTQLKWIPNLSGVKIPYYHPFSGEFLGNRWWAYEKNRTWGHEGKHKDAIVYCNPLTEWSPEMYVVEGETSLAAMYAAGMMNTIAIWGISATVGLSQFFVKRNIFRAIMICDNDDAGLRGAVRIRDELLNGGIDFEARSIDKYVGHKGDVGDLWRALKNEKIFSMRVKHSPQIQLPESKKKEVVEHSYDTWNNDTDKDLIERVVSECIRRSQSENPPIYNGNMKMRSPLREDRSPSFTLNIHTGVAFDHSDLKGWSAKQLAEELGVI